jgi:hypothetical protein
VAEPLAADGTSVQSALFGGEPTAVSSNESHSGKPLQLADVLAPPVLLPAPPVFVEPELPALAALPPAAVPPPLPALLATTLPPAPPSALPALPALGLTIPPLPPTLLPPGEGAPLAPLLALAVPPVPAWPAALTGLLLEQPKAKEASVVRSVSGERQARKLSI